MRIISGNLKGKKISLPLDKNTRPLRDLVKESIFNVIKHSNKINLNLKNSVILDLFSGSGSFGFEAISRGAKTCFFIESYEGALKILSQNMERLKCEEFCKIYNFDCFDFIKNLKNKELELDIIFLDPPYKEKRINILLEEILKKKILNKNGIMIIHRHKNDNIKLTEKLNLIDLRQYGISKILFAN